MAPPFALLLALLAVAASTPVGCEAATFGFDFHHRFSDTVRQWAESREWVAGRAGTWDWPEKESVEYYAALAEHDRVLRGRGLAGADSLLTFAAGNTTIRISTLGFLHYALVSVGTPSKSFLVALDTGSDLFWLPCDCKSCASTSARDYGLANIVFSIYSPNTSSTSKKIPCSNSYCDLQSQCSGAGSTCPYEVAYVSANTSSSGILVQDVLHLVTDDSRNETVQAQVIFGCGETQTGSFLDSAAPNGLFGLGLENISVPSILSRTGLTSDSFSMCFGRDGIGRITFGDEGSSDQHETPLNIHGSHPTYNVTVTGLRVGNSSIVGDFSALMDSGTSFTYLADPVYTSLTESFDSKIQDDRRTVDSSIPFEYCYTPRSNSSVVPTIGLKMKGGSKFPVTQPLIIVSTRTDTFYCLAVVQSRGLNIIGQNFMTGLLIVFDREKLVLGWKKFNCSDVEDSNPLPVNPRDPIAPSPSISVGPSSYNPEATETRNNSSQSPVLPTSSSSSLYLNSSRQIFLTLFLLSIAIL
uniref:Aspartic proteinase-like protein 1 n=1 Tax=Anthurium amnicola TaxID=1678845 RepID=A0A1D1XVD0_9ARAE